MPCLTTLTGVFAAKNVILAGVKAVALYDPSPVEIKDLGTQFYLADDDVGKPTASACKDRLQELNKAVQVGVIDAVSEAGLAGFQARSMPHYLLQTCCGWCILVRRYLEVCQVLPITFHQGSAP